MAFHSQASLGARHAVHNFEYANEAARLGAILIASDVGKVARQLDNESYYILVVHSPIEWKQLSLGGSIVGLVFADETARLAFSSVPSDVGRVALQSDNDTLYALTDDSPATWVLLGPHYFSGTGNPNGVLAGEFGQDYYDSNSDIWYKCISQPSGTAWTVS